MREKLIRLIDAAICDGPEEGCLLRKMGSCGQVKRLDYCALGMIADHLLANGVIAPPVNVGDTVWMTTHPWTDNRLAKPIEAEVNAIKKYSHGLYANLLFDTPKHNGTRDFNVNRIGKTVFLTREEAEAALRKEGKG